MLFGYIVNLDRWGLGNISVRGYNVSTVELNGKQTRRYIREQEYLDKQQMEFEFK